MGLYLIVGSPVKGGGPRLLAGLAGVGSVRSRPRTSGGPRASPRGCARITQLVTGARELKLGVRLLFLEEILDSRHSGRLYVSQITLTPQFTACYGRL